MTVPICLIVAVAENGVIGRDGTMPWRLSTDLKRFKALTMGNPVIMGRKTWNSLKSPLGGRANIIITRNRMFAPEGAMVAHSFSEARRVAEDQANRDDSQFVFVIGGGEIFKQALPFADRMYVTEIMAPIEGDTFFPGFNAGDWKAISTEMVPEGPKDTFATRFVIYKRQ
ncbi:dihydrofolate reductase [uncultured Bartonella sp.]|uniref:dihydrofolate reductase n=1 Tax=uncultured Bartonella sp. TaxID=104108 RepID=UPI00260255C5|nr:dihydrofolate reductase [uncultured Bartonella sp.]